MRNDILTEIKELKDAIAKIIGTAEYNPKNNSPKKSWTRHQ